MSDAMKLAARYSVPVLQRAIDQIESLDTKRLNPDGKQYLADLKEAVRLRETGVVTNEPTDKG